MRSRLDFGFAPKITDAKGFSGSRKDCKMCFMRRKGEEASDSE